MHNAFYQQYHLVQGARAALLDYCAKLRPEHLVAPVAAFNQSSVRDLLVHVAGAYHVWLGQVSMQRPARRLLPSEVPDVAALRRLYGEVDALVADFVQHFAGRWLETAEFSFPGRPAPLQLSPMELFTHVITHEFHHKGQVLSMGRQLGYAPVDTDVIRF
ncbi:DinB family protein [Hymenobacter sp. BT770]|uniref:DinB family protein n=1 Tax=Hymenobacter sp. BT770 TaxID=2886942 RepID=UPI001D0F8F48|nr:DinB family protein [Hymenobacter sp. BT770]MCC3152747.1 DinB family protein [Hymenobacter sp. BT770]MDO3414820.1 DinB family protein [Hymenobacter sp. BT770]